MKIFLYLVAYYEKIPWQQRLSEWESLISYRKFVRNKGKGIQREFNI
jgi:hypothetical protein